MKKFFYSLFFLLALVGLAGCGTQDTASNPATAATPTTPTTSTPTPTSQTLNQTGTGVVVAPSFTVSSAGNVVFALTHDGGSNFIVELKNSAGTTVNTLVNEIGSFTGQVDAALVPGEYHLSVTADGNWTAAITGFVTNGTVAPPTTDPAVGVPTTVVLLSTLAAGTQLSQGGETQVSATVRDVKNDLVPDGIIINFTTDKGTISSQSTTTNGVATVTFQAGSSAGAATVTASTLGAAGLVQGTTSIDIANGQSSSIVVSSVQPASIGIRGSGIEDTSLIVFEVRDDAGNPAIDGTIVSFSLSIAVNGGENLSASSAQSAGGLVSVALQSGTVSGTVAVRASVDKGAGTFLVTEAKITIANNRPDAGRITMGATVLNLAGGVTLGLQSEVNAYIGDRAGNVVPDGWPVSFISECGTIGTSGGFNTSTALGVASATFQTSAPDPSVLTGIAPLGPQGYCRLVAYTPGKGNFQDLNGNGTFDGSDVCVTVMDEPYIDANDSGAFETGEYYIDINNNGSFDTNVVNCVDDSMIWTSMNLMISDYAAPLELTPATFNLPIGGSQSFSLKIKDILGNSLVEGTAISISADGGSLV
ncbi:MAG: Ig-like domain-containing protein, partial [Geopsychrobacter sp.]|nr:Ig-like domain-containing protein [Geopsychrobacter sp.]